MFSFLDLDKKKPLQYSILSYIFSIIMIYIIKPDLCFKNNGEEKKWGLGVDETLFHFIIISLIISIFIYIFLTILE
jgi:hypothetical protein